MAKDRTSTAEVLRIATNLQEKMEASVAKSSDNPITPYDIDTKQNLAQIIESVKSNFFEVVSNNKIKDKSILVSIVIPVFNKVGYTLDCLDSLSKQKSKYPFEVIIVDNASTDETPLLVRKIPGIKYIRNTKNRGFVDGCNDGVRQAKGSVITLLNNDTRVMGGWLNALVDRLISDTSIGLVGSKIIYPDGTLQEAGGIIFNDGSGHNFGKNEKANDFEFNYFRDVDYCSGASIAFWKKDFNKLGGLDKLYAPAYYEDSDLAMSIRYKLNKRVVYEPHSILIHIEGGTSGTDISSGFKKYQVINREKFVKKWQKELKKYHYPPIKNKFIAARHGKNKKILVVDSIVPEYNKDSGSLRMSQLIKAMVDLGYDITFYADNRVATQPYTEELQSIGVEVVYGSGFTAQDFYRQRNNMYDVIILSRPTTAIWHIMYCQSYLSNARLIYDTVDLHYLRIMRQAETDKNKSLIEESNDWKRLEYYLMDQADATLLVSYEEKALLEKERPKLKTYTVSNINPRPNNIKTISFDDREGLLFMADYSRAPNHTAAKWFVEHIFPRVVKEIPDTKLTLLGSNPASIQSLANNNVIVTGFIEDVSPYYNASRVFICPLMYGAGVKGKVSESIAFGLPVVSTRIGTEGMHLEDSVSCLEAESEEDFAKQVIRLYKDKELWLKISQNSKKIYDRYFSPEAGRQAIKKALSD